MAKWIFALLVLAGTGAQAHEVLQPADGCAVLNDIVYEEVTASRWGMHATDLAHTSMLGSSIVICTDTTATVSKAFADAIRVVGGEMQWQDNFDQREDTCLSGFIEQCRPRNDGFSLSLWRAVSATVVRAMPEGPSADRSIFSRESMRMAVRASLRTSNIAVRLR